MRKFGLFVPPFDAIADPRLLADLAGEAEEAGWDGFFLWDHTLYAPPVEAVLDPWIALSAIAMRTERLVFGPMVTPLPRRRISVLARQIATLDALAPGRLVFGVGLGDDGGVGELSRFGEQADPRTRSAMLDEGLPLLRELLTGAFVEHRGRHYTADGVRLLPAPANPVPIWVAGRWPYRAPLQRAVKYDGAFIISIADIDQAASLVSRLRGFRGDLSGFDVVLQVPENQRAQEWAEVDGVTWLLSGFGLDGLAPDMIRARIRRGPLG